MKSPTAYINSLPEPHKSDIAELHSIISKTVPSLKSEVFTSASKTFIGYGIYDYKTKSGCEGKWFTIGLSSNKNNIALYACIIHDGKYIVEAYEKKLGKVHCGRSCIRFKKLADLDVKVLKQLLKDAAKIHASGKNEMEN